MDSAAFTQPSGKLLRIPRAGPIRAYTSFIPAALPPAFEMAAIAEVRALLSEADQAMGELIGIGRALKNPELLVRPYLRQEAVASSAIEGTKASFSDLIAYEAARVVPTDSDVIDVFNYATALDFGLTRVQEEGLTPDLVRNIHRTLMTGARGENFSSPGEFRTIQNHIGGGTQPADGDFVPPPPEQMHQALDRLFEYVAVAPGSDTPILVEAAWVHYQFETIHPFIDGNGRVGRVLIPLLIARRRHYEHPLLFLSPYFRQNRTRYSDLLFGVSAASGWTNWLRFFLEAVIARSREAIELSDRVIALGEEWQRRLNANNATTTARRLCEFVQQHIGLTAGSVELLLGVRGPAAYRAIAALERAEILVEVTGRVRDRVWVARELMTLLN